MIDFESRFTARLALVVRLSSRVSSANTEAPLLSDRGIEAALIGYRVLGSKRHEPSAGVRIAARIRTAPGKDSAMRSPTRLALLGAALAAVAIAVLTVQA